MTTILKAISIQERLPEIGKWITTIDEAGNYRVCRITEYGWQMRDPDGVHSPSNNLPITHWLEEIPITHWLEETPNKSFSIEKVDRYWYWSGRNYKTYVEVTFWFDPFTQERSETTRSETATGEEYYNLPAWAKSITTHLKHLDCFNF